MDTMGALGLGIVLTLKDQVSAGLDSIRQKMTGFSGATQDMVRNFDEGAKQLLGGMASNSAYSRGKSDSSSKTEFS